MSEQITRPTNGFGFLKSSRGMALSAAAVIAAIITIGLSWNWLAAAAIAPLLLYIVLCGAMFAALLYLVLGRHTALSD